VTAAVEMVSAAVESGDVRAALRGTGVLAGDPSPIGPGDPEEVEEEADVAKREREGRRMLAF
jgi:hypothetical protein